MPWFKAIAQTPSLTLAPPSGSVSRQLINTSWQSVCDWDDGDWNDGPTILDRHQLAGWSMLPTARHKDAAFEIWANGNYMQTAQGRWTQVQDAPGAGQAWLGLTNGVGGHYQAPGIAQTVNTIAGAQYTFSFDYAGQLGLDSANTQVNVYLDGQLLGSYANQSANSLNWQALSYSFTGDGQAHTLSIQLANGTDTRTPRGAMLDALSLVETLPQSAATVYGFAGSPILLPKVADALSANDPTGLLSTTISGLPAGAVLSDGTHLATVTGAGGGISLGGWNLNALALTLPQVQDQGRGGGTVIVMTIATRQLIPLISALPLLALSRRMAVRPASRKR